MRSAKSWLAGDCGNLAFAARRTENTLRIKPSRSRCAVSIHQPDHEGCDCQGRTRSLRGYEEEGTGRRFQEPWQGVTPQGGAGAGPRARFRNRGAGQGGPLWSLRYCRQSGLGERWHRRRHRCLCR